ncbi:Pet127-domain-containing protein [Hypoxylon sp. FL0890]|nr:Pet127-domain-containing protein [Hypoxylon sp. FL0890]
MLRLSGRSAPLIGTSYVCASCLAASHSTRSLTLRRPALTPTYHGRPLSSTSRRPGPAPTAETSTPDEDGAQNIDPKKKNKKKPKKANAQQKIPPLSKHAISQGEDARQLNVLQGALQALKNVLAAQNISIDQIATPVNHTGQKVSESKTKAKVTAKSSSKAGKASNTEAHGSDALTKLLVSMSNLNSKLPDNEAAATPRTTPEPPPTLSGKPADPNSTPGTSGRSRRAKSKKSATKQAKSKGKSPSKKSTAKAQNEPAKPTAEVSHPSKPGRPEKQSLEKGSFAALRKSLKLLSDHVANDEKPLKPLSDRVVNDEKPLKPLSDRVVNDEKSLGADLHGDYKIIGQPFTGESPPENVRPSKKASKSQKGAPLFINSFSTKDLNMFPIEAEHPPVPGLSYGLERVLFNPGVYFLQDPRSRVYNFDPYLSEIMPIQEFDFNALKQYVTSSKDSNLIRIARENNKKYTGSTSSMTSMLSHFHYLLSSWREINTNMLSRSFVPDSSRFTKILRGPAAIFLHWKDGTYAIDADKEFDSANILSMLGKSMEKLLTLTKEEYERYRHINSDQITEEERNAEEAFHYTGFRDFMMRSQLDAHDPRVPGSGMFDLKTRAVVSIRMDAKGFHKGLGYEIRNRFGQWESFEREYYDMIRSAFLKYSLQVRMGRMDGIFVAFHNTQRIFGFQYIPLPEMDLAIHGTSNTTLGTREYKASLILLNDILDRATKKFPEQSLRMHFETRTSVEAPFMYIFAKPVTAKDIEEVQSANRASIEAFEREIFGLAKDEAEAESEPATENEDVADEDETEESSLAEELSSLSAWKEVRQMVEDAVDDDELGVGVVKEAIEDALEQSGLLHAKSSAEARGYVDALLGAIISSKSEHEELPVAIAVDDTITHEDDSQPPTAESESSGADQLIFEPEPDANQSQIHDRPIEQAEEPSEQVGNKSATEPESVLGQDGEPSITASAIEDPAEKAKEPADSAVLEQAPSTEMAENKSDESTELIAKRAPEEESFVEEEENEDDDEETDDVDDELETEENKSASTMSPLKDLIVKMAQTFDERRVSDDESALNDSSKLKEFERILGELIARSKDEQAEQETESGPATDTDAESEDQSQAETTGSTDDTTGTQTSTEQSSSKTSSDEPKSTEEETEELLGLVLSIKNKVNGKYVNRPENLNRHDNWIVEYNIEEITGKRAHTIYQQCISRRKKVFAETEDKETEWYKMFQGNLEKRTMSGRKFRASETAKAKKNLVHVVGQKPMQWHDVFGKNEVKSEPLDQDEEDDVDDVDGMDCDTEREGCHL